MTALGPDSRGDETLREEAAAWLARLRGPVNGEDQAAFEEWYNAGPDHATAYDAILETWSLAGQADDSRQPPARSRLAARHGRGRRYALTAIAATVAIACLAFAAFAGGLVPRRPAQTVEFASVAGEIRTIELADGSRVILDAATLLRTDYSPRERRIRLIDGRARFLVAHDRARPFVVATNAGLVIAHGTVFDVALAGAKTTVSLIEGSVEVRPTAGDHASAPRASTRLVPGQRVVLDGGRIETALAPATRPGDDWPNGMLSFEDAPLGEVVGAANRSGGGRILLAEPTLANRRFTGTFKASNTEELATLLAATFDLDLTRANDRTLLLRPSPAPDGKKIPG